MQKKSITVVAAILWNVQKDKILIAQRKDLGAVWEFPGGKVKENEIFECALKRELEEELNLEFFLINLCILNYSYEYPDIIVHLYFYEVELIKNVAPIMNVHQAFQWVKLTDINNYKFHLGNHKILKFLIQKN